MCRSAQNNVRSAQTNLTLDLTLVPALRGVRGWHEVGRGNPVMHDIADEFTCTSENNPYAYVCTFDCGWGTPWVLEKR